MPLLTHPEGGGSEENASAVNRSVPPEYFVDLYKQSADPWNFETSEYEREKYAATLAALPRSKYRHACELGCSIGVFTQLLAPRCERLTAVDVSEDALERARERCKPDRHIEFSLVDLMKAYPDGSYDLTVMCELGYYFSRSDLERFCERVVEHCAPAGHLIAVHFTPPAPGHTLPASEVHDLFRRHPRLRHVDGFDRSTYRLDLFERIAG